MVSIAVALVALALAAWAAWRAYVPPRQRDVNALQGRIEDCELALAELRERFTTRERREQMAHARKTHEERVVKRATAEEQAHAIIAAAAAAPPPPPPQPTGKAALRAALLARRTP